MMRMSINLNFWKYGVIGEPVSSEIANKALKSIEKERTLKLEKEKRRAVRFRYEKGNTCRSDK